jgi:3-oxoacyl-[acyl-carrier protein] reductase
MADRIAYVTSGATGLGYATVRALLEAGWDVFFTYRNNAANADTLVKYGQNLGRRVTCAQADLLDKSEAVAAAEQCLETFGRVDAFVHNFGPFVFEHMAVADYPTDLWVKMLDGNLTNFLWLYPLFAGGMRKNRFGRIVTVGFAGAGDAAGWRYRGPYAAAKSALASLTRTIAREERTNGITANMVCPGDIQGAHKMERIEDVLPTSDPVHRPPVGEDVARLIVFLCHPLSSQVNGTVTEITGGYDILHTNWKNER